MRIKICTDSTCDLGQALIKKYDITVSPLSVIRDGAVFLDMVNITPADIVAHVNAGGSLCSTAAVNEADYRELFEQLSAEYDAVIEITLGSGFSSCYQNACNAAEGLDKVYVVDSKNLSTGEGLLVLEAARLAEKGLEAEKIVKKLEVTREHVEASFVMDKLEYMRKGGRCSALTLLGANLLRIKPCIQVKDGTMSVAEKYRGSFSKCVENYVRERLEGRTDLRGDTVFITSAEMDHRFIEEVRAMVNRYAHFDEIIETNAGCTITCHCGPNTLGVLFITKEE